MKNYIFALLLLISLSSCVQKTKTHVVTLFLDVSGIKDIKSVGVRGEEKPFSWDSDLEMEVVKKDSIYKKIVEIKTGRLCSEIKFTVNGNFELKEKENRKVYLNSNGNTIYKVTFNK